MSTTKTKTSLKRAGKAGKGRDPKITALEQAIIADGKLHGMNKTAMVKLLRQWENQGLTADQIAGKLRFTEDPTTRAKELGANKPGDKAAADAFDKIQASQQPSDDDLDSLIAGLGAGDDPEDDDEQGL